MDTNQQAAKLLIAVPGSKANPRTKVIESQSGKVRWDETGFYTRFLWIFKTRIDYEKAKAILKGEHYDSSMAA